MLNISIIPRRIPPIIAPGIEPIPPNTAAINALIPGIAPEVEDKLVYVENIKALAMAARAEPMAKVIAMVLLTLTPIRTAASLSSDTATMARPVLIS